MNIGIPLLECGALLSAVNSRIIHRLVHLWQFELRQVWNFAYSRHLEVNLDNFRLDETAEAGVYDQRGRRKTAAAGLHTNGAKRAESWLGAVKWGELAIGLAVASVASGGERGKDERRSGLTSKRHKSFWSKH